MGIKLQHIGKKSLDSDLSSNIFTLPSGLTFIHQYISTTEVVAADVWIKAGASAEPEEWSGMAHFLEHMVFKGTQNIMPGEFDYVVENTGAFTNAATSHDYTHFFLNTAVQYLPETLPYLAEILLQASIPDEEFYREREVVLEEIRSSYDDPDWIAFQALSETIYQYHPYKREILGIESFLRQHTPHQMRCFHKTYYQPENMTVVLVGGIKEKQALSLVNKAFNDFSIRSESPCSIIEAEPPLIGIRRTELSLPRLGHSRLSMGWVGPGVENLEEAVALDLLSIILASGRTSRLVRQLREEKHLVLDISSSFSLQKDSSLFTINVWLHSKNFQIIEDLITTEIYALQTRYISEAELNMCKKSLFNDYIFSTETPSQLAGLYGYYQTISNLESSLKYPEIIKSLSAQDLQCCAHKYLSPQHYAIALLQPC